MTKIKELIQAMNLWAPPAFQESYDNAGLITGSTDWEIAGCLLTLDATEKVVEEAISKNCNLIVAHHPIVFSGLKSLTGRNYVERTIIKAIKNNIAILACHTNLDNVITGVNSKIAHLLELKDCQILRPKKQVLSKLVCFLPETHLETILGALHNAGAGWIGEYSECSFSSDGEGRFRPGAESNPFLGRPDRPEIVKEKRIEVQFPSHKKKQVVKALQVAHPYEEAAFFIQSIENEDSNVGSGLVGNLAAPKTPTQFIEHLKTSMNLRMIKATAFCKESIVRVALCGGSGSFLLEDAVRTNADVFITADYKYHQFFDADNRITICDIGHYESEVFTKELMAGYLTKKFTTFAIHLSQVNTNPIQYY